MWHVLTLLYDKTRKTQIRSWYQCTSTICLMDYDESIMISIISWSPPPLFPRFNVLNFCEIRLIWYKGLRLWKDQWLRLVWSCQISFLAWRRWLAWLGIPICHVWEPLSWKLSIRAGHLLYKWVSLHNDPHFTELFRPDTVKCHIFLVSFYTLAESLDPVAGLTSNSFFPLTEKFTCKPCPRIYQAQTSREGIETYLLELTLIQASFTRNNIQ